MNEQKNIVIPKIKLDETRTYIINRDEILDYIKYYINEEQLVNFRKNLVEQTKISTEEVQDLIEAIDSRLLLFNNYKLIQNDFNSLETFYSSNLAYLGNAFMKTEKHELDRSVENLLISFLNYSITREEQGIQNEVFTQNLFNKLKFMYDSAYLSGRDDIPKFYDKIHDIMRRKDNLINRLDESANEFSDLSKTTVLSLNMINNPGHSITEEDIDNKKVGGFIITSIILQSSLILAFILSLIALFNK